MTKKISLGKYLLEIPDGTEKGKTQLSQTKGPDMKRYSHPCSYFQTSHFSGILCFPIQFVSPRKPRHGAEQLSYQRVTERRCSSQESEDGI